MPKDEFLKRHKTLIHLYKRVLGSHALTKVNRPLWRRVVFNWRKGFRRLLPLGGVSDKNHVYLFHNGDEALVDMMQAIDQAKKHVWIEIYTFEPDAIGLIFLKKMIQACERGCEVVLLYDHFGSSRLSFGFLEPFLRAGGKASPFNPIWPWRRKGPFLFRDHRKLLIVDDAVAYCGSLNIGTDYAGKLLGEKGRFRDTVAKLQGSCVASFGELFLFSWQETTGEIRSYQPHTLPDPEGSYVQVLGSNTHRNLFVIQQSMAVTLGQATHFCFLTSPYFLPNISLKKALIDAAERGVDVRILTAGLSDIPLMRLASQHVYGQLLQAGVRIYEMFAQTLHAKIATIDGVYGSVGSYNLDHWSARRNLELNVTMWDKHVAENLEKQFHVDLKLAKEVTFEFWNKRTFVSKALQWLSYQLMRL